MPVGTLACMTPSPRQDTTRHRGHRHPRGGPASRASLWPAPPAHPGLAARGAPRAARAADTARAARRTAHAARRRPPRCSPLPRRAAAAGGAAGGQALRSAASSCRYLSPLIHQRDDKSPGRVPVPSSQAALRPHLRGRLVGEVSNCEVTSPQEGLFLLFLLLPPSPL